MTIIIDNIKITTTLADLTKTEARDYIAYVRKRIPADPPLVELVITLCDDGKVDVEYKCKGRPFERIRRITGYLVGTTDRWNDSKQAEERERVKHAGDNYHDF